MAMSSEKLLALFGGSEQNLSYFMGLRACIESLRGRKGGGVPSCDPRDVRMVEMVNSQQWRPKLVEKLPFGHGLEGTDLATPASKQTALEDEEFDDDNGLDRDCKEMEEEGRLGKDKDEDRSHQFVCGVQGCSLIFQSLASYESHYHTCHNYECANCKRSFVSDFLLDRHLEENHDSYFQILCSRIDMYRCLVESCESKFRTPDLRKDHLVVHHKFPASFSFHQPLKARPKLVQASAAKSSNNKNDSSEMKTSAVAMDTESESAAPAQTKKRSGRKKKAKALKTIDQDKSEMDVDTKENEETEGNMDVTHSTGSTAMGDRGRGKGGKGNNRVPQTICFGRGSQRAFQHRGRGRHWHQFNNGGGDTKVDIEKMDFKDISDALDI